ncbi:MAG: FAD:protein FMN transferase [Clostridiales bacterium]|nr:FAD:protein FMN transferase [Clostridiales bacterium]
MKQTRRRIVALIICIALQFSAIWLLGGCTQTNPKSSQSFFALDTYINITVYGHNADNLCSGLKDLIREYDKKLSYLNQNSIVYKLNKYKTAQCDSDISGLFNKAYEMSDITGGYFDITVFSAVKAWGFIDKNYRVPAKNELLKLAQRINYENVSVNGNTVSISENCEIDLGGCAKGYICDKCTEYLNKNSAECAVIDLGGNICTYGKKPNGEKFNIAIESPEKDGYIAYLSLDEANAVTSGGYQRNFTDTDGTVYCHIIDPITASPVQSDIKSVTVISDNGVEADCLSTALFAMGSEKAIEFINNHSDKFGAVLLDDNNEIYCSPDLEDKIQVVYKDFKRMK